MKKIRQFANVHEPEMVLGMVQVLGSVHPEMEAEAGGVSAGAI